MQTRGKPIDLTSGLIRLLDIAFLMGRSMASKIAYPAKV